VTAPETRFTGAVAAAYDESRRPPVEALQILHDRVAACAALRPDSAILEAGTGTGAIAGAFLGRGYQFTGVDSSIAMLGAFRARAVAGDEERLVLGDLRRLPLCSGCFDAVLAVRVLGVVPGWRRAIDECLRVLRAGGTLVVGRTVRPPDSFSEDLRCERNRLLAEGGFDAQRSGARDGEALDEIAARTSGRVRLEPVTWETESSLESLLDRNLSGWRIQGLEPALRSRLRQNLENVMTRRWGDLSRRTTEQTVLQLDCFRR
jgi:SAM-dependent methyltransferase